MTPLAIDKVLQDTRLLGAALTPVATWQTWTIALKAAFALPLTEEEREVFTTIAGNRGLPKQRVRELWCVIGRRGGKSRMAAALAIYFACFVKHRLAAGERGMVLVLAATTEQAKVVFDYALAFLRGSAALAKEIESTTRHEIRLKNGIVIAIHSNSFRSVRGRTLCACIFDEVAFWRDETTATPDAETYTAVLPALATTNGMLVGISSPYRRMGLLHAKHKRYWGVASDDTLVVQGSSKTFNQTLSDDALAAQQAADPTAARSEWAAEFRADIAGFLDDELIDRAVDRARPLELPPRAGQYYRAFVDVSGGAAGGDAYTIAIAHKAADTFIIDAIRGRTGPFDPGEVTAGYAQLMRDYRCGTVTGDHYAQEWVTAAWRREHMTYVRSTLTASQLYLEALPLFTRGLVTLPDHPTLLRELRLLERTPTRMGKDQVTHPRNCHDDHANCCCGVLCGLANYMGYNIMSGAYDDYREPRLEDKDAAYRSALAARIFQLSSGQCWPR